MYLLAVVQGQPANILHNVLAEVACRDRGTQNCYRDHQLALAFHSQLMARNQLNDKSQVDSLVAPSQILPARMDCRGLGCRFSSQGCGVFEDG
jgi:hypothetical protein